MSRSLLWAAEFAALPLIWAYWYWLGIAHWPTHILYGVASMAWPAFLLHEAGV